MRQLTVAGTGWCWRVRRDGPAYPGHVIVRVWPDDDDGAASKLDVRVRWDDPWLNLGTVPSEGTPEVLASDPVTPRLVAAAITQALAAGWDPGARGTTTVARWDGTQLTLDASG